MTRLGALLVLVASSCIASGCTTYVVGDSTARQVVDITGWGDGHDGCGFLSGGFPTCPPVPRVVPEHGDQPAIIFLSIRDAREGDTNYSDVDTNGPAIFVELPPSLGAAPFPTLAEADAFNAAVSADLGCDLAPWSIRDTWPNMWADGVHYTTTGAQIVAARLELLEGPVCP